MSLPETREASAALGPVWDWLHAYALGTEDRSVNLRRADARWHPDAQPTDRPWRHAPVQLALLLRNGFGWIEADERRAGYESRARAFAASVVAEAVEANGPDASDRVARLAWAFWQHAVGMIAIAEGASSRAAELAPLAPLALTGLKIRQAASKGGRGHTHEQRSANAARNAKLRSEMRGYGDRRRISFHAAADRIGAKFDLSGKQVRRICADLKW